MDSKPRRDRFRWWLLGGILWVAAAVVLNGISQEHGMWQPHFISDSGGRIPLTPEQQRRESRIQVLETVGSALTWGVLVYGTLGLVLFRGRSAMVIIVGIIVLFVSSAIIGIGSINNNHDGSRGYQSGQLANDIICFLIFTSPLALMLVFHGRTTDEPEEGSTPPSSDSARRAGTA